MREDGERALVLVVDDDLDHLLMLETVLGAVGYEVLTASSRTEGRAVLERCQVDVLVADLSLGDGTAPELLAALPDGHRPRVALVLSGFDGHDDVARSLAAGFDAHLVKPTALEQLRRAITTGLAQRPAGRLA